MQAKSAIEKGKRFEKFVAEQVKEMGIDPNAHREIGSGSGTRKGDIDWTLDFLPECKNEARVNFLPNVDQAIRQAAIGNANKDKWLLISRDPRFPEFERVYATIDLYQFLTLYKKAMEPKIVSPDRAFKYDLENLKRATQKVIKQLE